MVRSGFRPSTVLLIVELFGAFRIQLLPEGHSASQTSQRGFGIIELLSLKRVVPQTKRGPKSILSNGGINRNVLYIGYTTQSI